MKTSKHLFLPQLPTYYPPTWGLLNRAHRPTNYFLLQTSIVKEREIMYRKKKKHGTKIYP
jgi:hypothetical protein